MATESEIRDLFKNHGVGLARDDVWTVQGQHVIRHKALERLAAAIRLRFDSPQILRAERDEAVILLTGRNEQGVSEWSIGEALVNVNYRVSGRQAAYVYAMAEKRAKDRVIIKLAGLHGVYSEDEADDFKHPAQQESPIVGTATAALRMAKTEADLTEWYEKNKGMVECLQDTERDAIRAAYKSHLATLRQKEAA